MNHQDMASADELVAQAYRAHASGDFASTLELSDRLLASWPTHLEALLLRAMVLNDMNRPEDAAAAASEALAVDPDSATAHLMRARAFDAIRRYTSAAEDYRFAAEAFSGTVEAAFVWLDSCRCALLAGDEHGAKQAVRRAYAHAVALRRLILDDDFRLLDESPRLEELRSLPILAAKVVGYLAKICLRWPSEEMVALASQVSELSHRLLDVSFPDGERVVGADLAEQVKVELVLADVSIALLLDRPADALALAQQLVGMSPELPAAWVALSRAQSANGLMDEAEVSAERATELSSLYDPPEPEE